MRTCRRIALGAVIAIALHGQPEFEVASVRPSNPDQNYINSSTPSLNIGGDRYLRFGQITLRDLIMLAYKVGASQIQGPGFLNGTPDNPAGRFVSAPESPPAPPVIRCR